MAASEHKKYHFKASEFGDGTPYISTEPMGGKLTVLKDSTLYFTLSERTSLVEAERIAKYLNENIVFISTTTFGVEE